uniref:Minor tail protein n=1 Tax=Siphoviridae sp. ct96x5 TaxID=2825367 RepID=A0A8S5PSD4_9CAUD|nr:MAG TPA: minor tail protein [Siphoviridae sp. ct96x5]
MVYMANELAVKVKVNLDATQDALKTQFGNIQKYADNNPVKVALKIDKKSLENSLREAFGKDAANSIKKNLKNAVDIGDVGKNAFKSATQSLNSLLSKEDELKGKVRELNNLLSQEKYITEQIGKVSGNESKLNELNVWQERLNEIQSQQKAVFDSVDKVDIGAFDELLANDRKYLQLTKEITEAKELQTAKLKDAAAASAKMDITKSAKDDIASERDAVDQVITALEKRNSLQVQYYNEIKAGRTGNADEIDQSVKRANHELSNAIDSARAFGVNLTDDKRYMEALASGAEKVTVAQNNANKALNNSAIKEQAADIQSVVDSINAYADATKKLYDAQRTGNDKDVYGYDTEQVEKRLAMAQAMADYETKYGEKASANVTIANALNAANAKNTQSYNKLASAVEDAVQANDMARASMQNYTNQADTQIRKLTENYGKFGISMTDVTQKYQAMETAISKATPGQEAESLKEVTQCYKELGAAIAAATAEGQKQRNMLANKTGFDNLSAQLDKFVNQNPNLSSNADLWKQIQQLDSSVKNYSGTLEENRAAMASVQAQAEALGLTTEMLGQKFTRLWKEHAQTAAVMAGLHLVQQGMRQVYDNVVEVNSAMTELKKVTNETDTAYLKFTQRAAQQSRELGANISDYVQTTADWARLGYNLPSSEELARVSSLFANVGDGIDSATQASEYLISTLKGFNLVADDAERVVDVINQVANTEPVSAQDISEILQRSAAALSASNTSFEKTVALGTAMNSVLQNSATTGTALKTLSMYLRATKTELEENGEDAEYCASSMSELRDSILALTKGKVDIQLDEDTYKDVYDIMQEISGVYDQLTDKEQASLLNLLGGKRNANAVQALIQQFQIAEDTLNQTQQAAGSAMKENDTYMSSIQGKLNQLSSAFQNLSINLLDSDIVKFFVDLATGVTDFTNGLVKANELVPTLVAAVSTYGTLSKKDWGKVNMPAYIHCQENIGCKSINIPLECWETLKPYYPIAC